MSALKAARNILGDMRRQFSKPHSMIPADEHEFGHLNLSAYSAFVDDLQPLGFKVLGDLEIPEVSNSPTTVLARTMIRNMLSADGHVIAQYYQVKPRIWRRVKVLVRGLFNLRLVDAPVSFLQAMVTRHCVSFETEFEDGRQLITSNAEAAGMISDPPSIDSTYFPYGTPTTELLERHVSRLSEVSTESPPLQLRSMDDVLQMQKRQSMLKVAHRNTLQWVSHDEILAMSGGNNNLADDVFREIQKLIIEERDAA